MRLRGPDLEDTPTLHELLLRGLGKISNRLAALAPEASPDIADALGDLAVDVDALAAIPEVLISRSASTRNQ